MRDVWTHVGLTRRACGIAVFGASLAAACATGAPDVPEPRPARSAPASARGVAQARAAEAGRTPQAAVEPAPAFPPADVPCTPAPPSAFFPGLRARVLHRLAPPAGFRPRVINGPIVPGLASVIVKLELDERGTILRFELERTSGVAALDEGVLAAVAESGCFPPPPGHLLHPKTRTLRLAEEFQFERRP